MFCFQYVLFMALCGSLLSVQDTLAFNQNPCVSQKTCGQCIRTTRCVWCMKEISFFAQPGPMFCNNSDLLIPENELKIVENSGLQKSKLEDDVVQLKPQKVSLQLRVNDPLDLNIFYEQVEDYPVDLYFLMDLSKSMEDDKENLSLLGDKLAQAMRNITSNFRLGFGSFVDKVVMPFVSTVGENLVEPCEGCAAPYGFQHHMNLSKDTSAFSDMVRKAQVSGNLDGPEGGLDAVMQAIACKKSIGWRDKARKVLVFATDAAFHLAGDGLLGGLLRPNDGLCHMDSHGFYVKSENMDYPSIPQINHVVNEHAVNMIFAVTERHFELYQQVSKIIKGSYVGVLSADSSNIVDLVKAEFKAISSSVEMKDNSTNDIKVTYYSRCSGKGPLKQTSECSGLKTGTRIRFLAKIEVIRCPKDPKEWQQRFDIYPLGINESLTIDLEILCKCDCEKRGNPGFIEKARECSGQGTYNCGICKCDQDFFGRNCECDAENLQLDHDDPDAGCRRDNQSTTVCSNRGDCICGKCECHSRDNPLEVISGEFCECDNFSCDRHNGLLCSGPDHGKCVCGKCVCHSEFDVAGYSACECRASNDTCITPYGEYINKICSGHGECVCGECKCFETDNGQYSGKYCEECQTCPGTCESLIPCVQCLQFSTTDSHGTSSDQCRDQCRIEVIEVDSVEDFANSDRELCHFIDDENCTATFVPAQHETTDKLQVFVQKQKDCPVEVIAVILGVIAAILAIGLSLILTWKGFIVIQDKREYARFEKERIKVKFVESQNPIFRPATSTYMNPIYSQQ